MAPLLFEDFSSKHITFHIFQAFSNQFCLGDARFSSVFSRNLFNLPNEIFNPEILEEQLKGSWLHGKVSMQ